MIAFHGDSNIRKCREAARTAAEAMAEAKTKGPALGWNVSLEQMLEASAKIDQIHEAE